MVHSNHSKLQLDTAMTRLQRISRLVIAAAVASLLILVAESFESTSCWFKVRTLRKGVDRDVDYRSLPNAIHSRKQSIMLSEAPCEDIEFMESRRDCAYFATCPRGFEKVLKDELESPFIRASNVKVASGGCSLTGDVAVGYRSLLWLRTSYRFLQLIVSGNNILTKDNLYELVSSVCWSKFMNNTQTLQVDAVLGTVSDGLSHSHYTALTVKFRKKYSLRPSVDLDDPDLPLVVYIDRGKASLYRSMSGVRSMHKRGYRSAMHVASLKENVAAALIMSSGWDPSIHSFCDPMCGSGTLGIEAALLALRRAPGLQAMGYFNERTDRRKAKVDGTWHPSVQYWPDFIPHIWANEVNAAKSMNISKLSVPILLNDWHEGALSLAYGDACRAGVVAHMKFFNEDVASFTPPVKPDFVLTNPPWNMRLEDPTVSVRSLVQFVKNRCEGSIIWILCGNPNMERTMSMKASNGIRFSAGGLRLQWNQFIIYKKKKK